MGFAGKIGALLHALFLGAVLLIFANFRFIGDDT
jgi:hypothetical protein